VSTYTIANAVPTPEELGEILGLGSDRVTAVRRIMSTPAQPGPSRTSGRMLRKPAKKSRRAVAKK
jgi:hypothetical protein